MTKAEVLGLLDKHFPPSGRFKKPWHNTAVGDLAFILDPSDGRYNAEIVDFTFMDGRVTHKVYMPD
jgi:hypothetical protein